MQKDRDHRGWCHPGGWGSRVSSQSKLVSSFSRRLWISCVSRFPPWVTALDSLGDGRSLGSSRWNKPFPPQAVLSYCLFRSTENLTMTVSMWFQCIFSRYLGKMEESLSGFILHTPRSRSRVCVHFPSSLFREPGPHIHPRCPQKQRDRAWTLQDRAKQCVFLHEI